jgi:MFS transporter, NNP family, nitrate/nitrite transporter
VSDVAGPARSRDRWRLDAGQDDGDPEDSGHDPASASLRGRFRRIRRVQRCLPTYLTTAFGLERSDAALRTAGFVVLAVILRPIGGWLSDRLHPVPVLVVAYTAVAVLALVASLELPLIPIGTIAFLGMAAALGAGTGAVFALVARLVEPERVGSVTGVVGAAGGLGGFFPPLVMGLVYGALDDYMVGYLLLALTAAIAAVFTATVVRRSASR